MPRLLPGYTAVGLSRCGRGFCLSGLVSAVRLAQWARWHGAGDVGGPGGCGGSVPAAAVSGLPPCFRRSRRWLRVGWAWTFRADGLGLPRRAPAHRAPGKRLKSTLNGQSGRARQTQSASIVPGAITGLVLPQGIGWLVPRSHAPLNVGMGWSSRAFMMVGRSGAKTRRVMTDKSRR